LAVFNFLRRRGGRKKEWKKNAGGKTAGQRLVARDFLQDKVVFQVS
jgi:hypothetical protein